MEEKAPLLMQQKEDYEHAKKTVENMALKLDANIKECRSLQNVAAESERKVEFQKREEKRLHSLCVDLSQQVTSKFPPNFEGAKGASNLIQKLKNQHQTRN